MISKQKIEFIRSLADKRGRKLAGCFVAEGEKIVSDLLKTSLQPVELYYTGKLQASFEIQASHLPNFQISEKEMERISAFKTPSSLLALFEIPSYQEAELPVLNGLALVLDGIQDPGNLGTIVRTADWFGISDVYCSPECADIYNPKCVQSSMGALARVRVHYTELTALTRKALNQQIHIYGTFMEGENLFETSLDSPALIVMGSEGKGISPELLPFLTRKISIPAFPAGTNQLESLNVAVSAAIVCAEFRRRGGN
jgi:TrmH family RNA methyltransferase